MPTQRRRRPNMRLPCKMTSKSIFHSDPRLPTFQQRAESATPATQMKKCPVFGTCHARRRSRPQNVPKVARRPREMDSWLKNEHGSLVKRYLWKRPNQGPHFAQACAVEMDISQKNFCAKICGEQAGAQRAYPDLTPASYSYRKNPSVWTVWGITTISHHHKI